MATEKVEGPEKESVSIKIKLRRENEKIGTNFYSFTRYLMGSTSVLGLLDSGSKVQV